MARYGRLTAQPTLFGEWALVREWGRIGRGGQVKTITCPSESEAASSLATLSRQKTRRGYQAVILDDVKQRL
ncbi:WGR domain-containing protein (plasmid) [Peteryoungia desertarenae]|uniref:WGR domain-containing protein n=2 Tax=Peteryoungia desertarenae TaxID=1813451 RepID=A0ABX6QUY2_9HYPH|nr:WGR domain-containing protein [Peteryoungia desertarenae]